MGALLSPPLGDGNVPLPDEFEDDILKVYGTKRPARNSIPKRDVTCSIRNFRTRFLSNQLANSEESSVTTNVALLEFDTVVHGLCTAPHSKTVPDVQSRTIASTDFVAADVQADRTDDGPIDDPIMDPTAGDSICQITQDEDLDSPVYAEIAHLSQRVTEDLTNDDKMVH